MQGESIKVTEVLKRENYVSSEDLDKAKKFEETKQGTVIQYLLDNKLITRDLYGQAVAESLGVPYADLNTIVPTKEQILEIPEQIARKERAVLFKDSKEKVTIASDNPTKKGLKEYFEKAFKADITMAYSLTEDIDRIFMQYTQALDTRFSKIIKDSKRVAPEMLDEIFVDAITLHASDIHFEPHTKDVQVRFRIDGVLKSAGEIPKEYYDNILNRVKVMSNERIDEHDAAQDGALRFEQGDLKVDMRVSIVPTVDGEKIVLRVLTSYVQGLTLENLGLSGEHQRILEEVASRPFGMILVTGPTGSGKTTTLYAVLKTLNSPDVNITTIEDPVEYRLQGVNQIQVDSETNLSFEEGLRSIVRQDPDIILVGEIRDEQTAEIAVNAALTGHLLLSTFHANDAATAIPRLLDMKIEPFLLSSTLSVVIAQRLVRRICDQCRHSVSMTKKEISDTYPVVKGYFKEAKATLYQGAGCSTCNNSGYKGRVGIYEFISVTPEMQDLILTNPSSKVIWKLAEKQGSKPLFDDGIEKVRNGVTTLEELTRVAHAPEG